MPRGDKSSYTSKQKRQAEHIEAGYEAKGMPEAEAEAKAWATVNKQSGSGHAKPAARTAAERSESAKKGAETRKRNAAANGE